VRTYIVKKNKVMDTLTIEIRNPTVRQLIDNLVSLNLIAVVPGPETWRERWQNLSATLPDTDEVSEADILAEVKAVRQTRHEEV
jgi:hypothetical protein